MKLSGKLCKTSKYHTQMILKYISIGWDGNFSGRCMDETTLRPDIPETEAQPSELVSYSIC